MFKRAVTRQYGQAIWRRNYYEQLIRSERELEQVTNYFLANPLHWEEDVENPLMKK